MNSSQTQIRIQNQAKDLLNNSIIRSNISQSNLTVGTSKKENEFSLQKSTTDSKKDPAIPGTTNQSIKDFLKEFMNIIRKGNLNEIIEYIEKYSLDVSKIVDDNFRHTPLYYSTLIKDENNAIKIMKYFLDTKVSPLYVDILNQTALFYAARENKAKCIDLLVENGCSVNHKDQYGQTPIYYSSREGHIECTKKLIDLNADVNNEDNQGQTPIFYAAKQGHSEICSILITAGAKINVQDRHKQYPILIAKKAGKTQVVDLLLALGAAPIAINLPKEKKRKMPKNQEERTSVKTYILTVFCEGKWVKVESNEFLNFIEKFPQVGQYLKNPSLLATTNIKDFPENIQVYDHWEKAATKIINHLWKFNNSSPFHYPVDPVALHIPDYFDVIKQPRDFSTIKQKLGNSEFQKKEDFISDLELVFNNCIEYNGPNSDYGLIAKQIREEFHNQLELFGFSFY